MGRAGLAGRLSDKAEGCLAVRLRYTTRKKGRDRLIVQSVKGGRKRETEDAGVAVFGWFRNKGKGCWMEPSLDFALA